MTVPVDTDYAYLAGIADGEGYFCASGSNPGLRVAVIDEALIASLHDRFGGYLVKGGVTKAGNRVYVWHLQRRTDLKPVLVGILPYLTIKRRQCEAMLELLDHLDNHPAKNLVPSNRLSPAQRVKEGRAEKRRAWQQRSAELRAAVAEAR